MRSTTATRSSIDRCRHGPVAWARAAAATAMSTSASVAQTARPTTSSVAGLTTSIEPVPDGACHRPPTNSCSRT